MIQIHLDNEHATNYINRIIENVNLKHKVSELEKANKELNQIIDQLQTDLDDLLADEDEYIEPPLPLEEKEEDDEDEEELVAVTAEEFIDFIRAKLYENHLKNKQSKE